VVRQALKEEGVKEDIDERAEKFIYGIFAH